MSNNSSSAENQGAANQNQTGNEGETKEPENNASQEVEAGNEGETKEENQVDWESQAAVAQAELIALKARIGIDEKAELGEVLFNAEGEARFVFTPEGDKALAAFGDNGQAKGGAETGKPKYRRPSHGKHKSGTKVNAKSLVDAARLVNAGRG